MALRDSGHGLRVVFERNQESKGEAKAETFELELRLTSVHPQRYDGRNSLISCVHFTCAAAFKASILLLYHLTAGVTSLYIMILLLNPWS